MQQNQKERSEQEEECEDENDIDVQKTVPTEYFGRIFALIFSIVKMGEPLSAAAYTVLLVVMDADYIFLAVGLTLTLTFFILSVRQGMQRDAGKKRISIFNFNRKELPMIIRQLFY